MVSICFLVGGGGKGSPPDVAGQIQLETFQFSDLGRIDCPANGPFGLVPGGKYFHLGLHIYDRRSLNLVAAKDFPGDRTTIRTVTFSPDGSRYAASLWQHNFGEESEPPSWFTRRLRVASWRHSRHRRTSRSCDSPPMAHNWRLPTIMGHSSCEPCPPANRLGQSCRNSLFPQFGKDCDFQDVDNQIPPGRDFRDIVSERVARCDVFQPVIEDAWLSMAGREPVASPQPVPGRRRPPWKAIVAAAVFGLVLLGVIGYVATDRGQKSKAKSSQDNGNARKTASSWIFGRTTVPSS